MKQSTKQIILTILFCLIFGMTTYAAEEKPAVDDTTATVTITNLAGYGGILELYESEELVYTDKLSDDAYSVSLADLPQGNYRVEIRGGVATYEPLYFAIETTYNSATGCYETEDVELEAKRELPDLTKLADRKTAKVGDRVKYTLQIALPEYAAEDEHKTCIISDAPFEGLAIDMSTIKIYASDENYQKQGEPIQMDGLATITMDLIDGMSIEITKYDKFREQITGKHIVVEYEAVVTEEARTLKSTENLAELIWRDGSDEDFVKVYTYRIHILKKDKDGNDLTGAVFTLSQDGNVLKFQYVAEKGAYAVYPDQGETDKNKFITELPVDVSGEILIQGLNLGVYTLREVKAPEGYLLSTEPITIVLKDGDSENTIDGKLDVGTINADAENQVEVTVYNYKTIFDVPVTGSGSFGLYVVIGTVCISLGLGFVAYGKKTRR